MSAPADPPDRVPRPDPPSGVPGTDPVSLRTDGAGDRRAGDSLPAFARLRRLAPYLILVAAFWVHALWRLDPILPEGDATEYLTLAWHLRHDHVFSMDRWWMEGPPQPSAYREPIWPLVIAGTLSLSPDARTMSLNELFDPALQTRLVGARLLLLTFLLGAALIAGAMAFSITGRRWTFYLAFVIVGFNDTTLHSFYSFHLEGFTLFLVTAATAILLAAGRRGGVRALAVAGLAFGLLALGRANFLYAPAVVLPVWAVVAWRRRPWRALVREAAAFLILFAVPVVPWMTRNQILFGRFILSERAGLILDYRAQLDLIGKRDYLVSFFEFCPVDSVREWGLARFGSGKTPPFLDESEPTSFYQRARANRTALLASSPSRTLADEAQAGQALTTILRHPFRHLLLCLPLAIRGIPRMLPVLSQLDGVVLVLFWSTLAVAARRLDHDLVIVLIPSAFSIGFNLALTDNLPRYGTAALGAMSVAVAWLLVRCADAWAARRKIRRSIASASL